MNGFDTYANKCCDKSLIGDLAMKNAYLQVYRTCIIHPHEAEWTQVLHSCRWYVFPSVVSSLNHIDAIVGSDVY
jgi:hypothetical protein